MTATYLGDSQQMVLSTYSHVLQQDKDRAREISHAFFAPPAEQSAQNVPPAGAGHA